MSREPDRAQRRKQRQYDRIIERVNEKLRKANKPPLHRQRRKDNR